MAFDFYEARWVLSVAAFFEFELEMSYLTQRIEFTLGAHKSEVFSIIQSELNLPL